MTLLNDGLLHQRVLYALLGAIAFSLLFKILPETYFNYVDKTTYYEIENQIKVESKIYKPCDNVNVIITRKSLIDGQGDSIINLSLVKEGVTTRERVSTTEKRVSISKGVGTIITPWALPCGINDGKYYFEGTIKYTVRGILKYTAFNTETFEVKGDAI